MSDSVRGEKRDIRQGYIEKKLNVNHKYAKIYVKSFMNENIKRYYLIWYFMMHVSHPNFAVSLKILRKCRFDKSFLSIYILNQSLIRRNLILKIISVG